MEAESQRLKGREDAISVLNATTEALNFAGKNSSVIPATTVFAVVNALLTMFLQ